MKYFLYIRKSTDEDDRQVLSLEAQETELKEFALRENLLIATTFWFQSKSLASAKRGSPRKARSKWKFTANSFSSAEGGKGSDNF